MSLFACNIKLFKINWLSYSYDCDTCGCSFATGATVSIEGLETFTLPAVAHCYAGESYDELQVYETILRKLGYEVAGT